YAAPRCKAGVGAAVIKKVNGSRNRQFDKAASYRTMSPQTRAIVRLRFVVAFLGEREQAAWWRSNFLSRNARAFMEPVFGTVRQARLREGSDGYRAPPRDWKSALIRLAE